MPNIYLDDNFPTHPKIVQAGPAAAWLYVSGLAYCSRHLTNGYIPRDVLPQLVTHRNVWKLSRTLLEVALWDAANRGFKVHDYETWNARTFTRRSKAKLAAQARWTPKVEHDSSNAPSITPNHAPSIAQRDAPSNALEPKNHRTISSLPVEHSPPAHHLTDEEEKLINVEAGRRMAKLAQPPNYPIAWLEVAKANLRRDVRNGLRITPADPPNAQRRDYDHPNPQCKTCGSTGWIKIFNTDAVTPCQACK